MQILASKPETPRISRKTGTKKQESLAHNKKKNYIIPDGEPCDFLIRLGVMDRDGRVFKKHYGKFRQINRYLEIVEDVPIEIKPNPYNERYLRTKQDRMGHELHLKK